MQLGFVSAILHDLTLEEVLRFAAEEGFATVELMSWPPGKADRKYAGVTHVDATDFTRARAEDLRALAVKHGIAISGLGYYPNPLSGDNEVSAQAIAHLRKVIVASELLDLRLVNTFIGADHRLHLDENFARFQAVWPDLVRFAEDHGVRLAIENCPMLFTRDEWPAGKNLARSPAVWRRMFEAIPSPNFGLNFDPSHLVWQFIPIAESLREFRGRLFHVHAKDLKIDRRQLDDHGILSLGWAVPRIPGHGDVDWNEFFAGLSEAAYAGAVCVEVEDAAFGKTLEGRKRALRISRNLLQPFFAGPPEESP